MSLIAENTRIASRKTKLQNVENTSNSSEKRRYKLSQALCGELSAHLTDDKQNSPRVVQCVNFQNVLPISKEELSSHVTHNAEFWLGVVRD